MSELARRLAGELVRAGVRHAFGVAGSGISYDLIACLAELGVPYYPAAHEAAAALMAGACGRDGRLRAAAIGIKGPGLANFVPGMLANRYEARAALTVSESYPSAAPAYAMHKRADHAALASAAAKGYARLDRELRVVGSLAELAARETPGPVHLDIAEEPEDAAGVRCFSAVGSGLPACGEPGEPGEAAGSDGGRRALERALEAVRRSERPAIVLGSVAARRLGSFRWDRIGVPVLTTAAAKGCVDERSYFYGGIVTGEIAKLSPERNVLREADLVVGIGLRNTEVVRTALTEAEIVIADHAAPGLNAGFGASAVAHPDDLEAACAELAEALSAKSWGAEYLRTYWRDVDRELFRGSWLPAAALRETQERLEGKETILTADTGLFCTVAETVWKARRPFEYCGSGNGRFMGISVPSAIGLAVAHPNATVVCVAGDGGIRPYLAELKLAVACKLRLVVLYMTDGGYGSIRRATASRTVGGVPTGGRPETGRPGDGMPPGGHPAEIADSSWYRPMAALGWEAARAESVRQLRRALARIDPDRMEAPFFLELAFDKARYTSMTVNLR